MLNVIYDNKCSRDLGLITVKNPNIPTPTRVINEIVVPGRDGTLTKDTRAYSNIEITVSFAFISELKRLKAYEVKNWLYNAIDKKLIFDDDLEVFYKVKYVKPFDVTRTGVTGDFTVTFVCEPYTYFNCYEIEVTNNYTFRNYHETSKPIITIIGEGLVNLNVNGNIVKANVGQNIVINSEKMLAYRIDGTMNNTSITGDYPVLIPGMNTISFTGNVTKVLVMPNWRCI